MARMGRMQVRSRQNMSQRLTFVLKITHMDAVAEKNDQAGRWGRGVGGRRGGRRGEGKATVTNGFCLGKSEISNNSKK